MAIFFGVDQVSAVLNVNTQNVTKMLPAIEAALHEFGLDQRPDHIAAIATVGTEVPDFAPIPEWGTGQEYEGRADLGNTQPGDGPRYKGRGVLQLTGRANYTYYGQALGIDLVGNPNLALDPLIAARVLAKYFVDRGVGLAAEAGNWTQTRILVNGGLTGWDHYSSLVNGLMSLPAPTPVDHITYPTVIHDTELRSLPLLTAVAHPVDLVKAGTTVTRLGPLTPNWLYIKLQDGRKGWLYRHNLSNS